MKKILMFAAVASIGIAAFSGCKKSSSSSPAYSMSATVTKSGSASSFSASGADFVVAIDSAGIMQVDGSQTTGTTAVASFLLELTSYTGPGTYSLSPSAVSIAAYYTFSPSYTVTSFAYGQIVITGVSGETISGTFNGTLTDSTVITNGKFTASGRGF